MKNPHRPTRGRSRTAHLGLAFPSPRVPAHMMLVLSALLLSATGRESFAAPVVAAPFLSFDVGTSPTFVAIADLNGDVKPDIVAANSLANTVSVLLGSGGGTFAAKTDYGTGGFPVALAIGDLNADGKPDLVAANETGATASVFLGNGDGTFGPKVNYGTGSYPEALAIGDLNADSKLDLAS